MTGTSLNGSLGDLQICLQALVRSVRSLRGTGYYKRLVYKDKSVSRKEMGSWENVEVHWVMKACSELERQRENWCVTFNKPVKESRSRKWMWTPGSANREMQQRCCVSITDNDENLKTQVDRHLWGQKVNRLYLLSSLIFYGPKPRIWICILKWHIWYRWIYQRHLCKSI